jgi:4-amino-4-deoxy-L-arabinose transferase-like glycosyltransferase
MPNRDLNSKMQPKAARHWWNWEDMLLILFVATVLYLPGLFRVPLFDRDEPRFATAAAAMIHSGNFIVPTFNGVLRPEKPPVIYWLMDISYALFGIHGGAARLPSVVASLLTLLVVYFMAGKRFGRAAGLLSALLLSVSALFFVESRLATADAVLVFFTTVCMGKLWDAWDARTRHVDEHLVSSAPAAFHSTDALEILRDMDLHNRPRLRWWDVAIFWIAMGLGILTKGVTPIFVLTTAVALSILLGWPTSVGNRTNGNGLVRWILNFAAAAGRQSWRWFCGLRPFYGILLLCAVVLPWFIAAWVQTHGALIERMITQNVLKRTTSGLQSHGEPPGFYLATIWGTFWPWSVLLVPAGFHAVRRARRIGPIAFDPSPYQFLLCWIIPSWLLFECFVTKMVEYDLPLFIPLAILCADTMVQSWHRLTDVLAPPWYAAARWVWSSIWIILGAGLLIGCWYLFLPQHAGEFNAFVPAAIALAATGVAGAMAWNRPPWPMITLLGFGLSLILLNTIALPQVKGLELSRRAGARMALLASQGYHLGAVGYIEPSLVFYSRSYVRLFSSPAQMARDSHLHKMGSAAKWAMHTTSRWCIAVDQRSLNYLRAHHYMFRRLDWFHGVKVAKGKFTQVTLITNVPAAPPVTPRASAGKHRAKQAEQLGDR